MAIAAQTASQLVVGSDGKLRASTGQIARTPSVMIPAAMAFFAVSLAFTLGMVFYWVDLDLAKKIHPDEVGYGHWYFAKFFRILFTVVISVVYVAVVLLIGLATFAFLGPAEAEKSIEEKEQAQENKTRHSLEQDVVAIANARVARFRQTRYGDQGGDELTEM